jgi:preprotein translocase subunit SecE
MFGKIFSYINESRSELKKVVWPSRKETIQHTIMVIVISVIVAAFIGIADYFLNLAVQALIV